MASTSPARISVWSDYVCPFCYLELPVLDRLQAEHAEEVEIDWRAFELRPEPAPTLDPNGDYLHRVWNQSVSSRASTRVRNTVRHTSSLFKVLKNASTIELS